MYLTDLSFIEEGTPDFTDDGLLNFSKMRMVPTAIVPSRCLNRTQPQRYEARRGPVSRLAASFIVRLRLESNRNEMNRTKNILDISNSCGVVVITSALHAEGLQFDPE